MRLLCVVRTLREGHFPSLWKKANVSPVGPKPVLWWAMRMTCDQYPWYRHLVNNHKQLEALVGRRSSDLRTCWSPIRQKAIWSSEGQINSSLHALAHMLHMWHKALDQRQSVRILFVEYNTRRPSTMWIMQRSSESWWPSNHTMSSSDGSVHIWRSVNSV